MHTPKEITLCPFCDEGTVRLTVKKIRHIPKGGDSILEGDWWVYRCDNCWEGFTTTESDTISQNNLKQRKL